ncbi:MAG: hypothetical protein QOI10_1200 [Solirubrobacterales bacterium]|jgi:uncharacterized protein (DUF2252 family)|nr:hypothetical protein [Solirubrobacterales bacterium]
MASTAAEPTPTAPPGATPSERAALGKKAREWAPRSSHGDWEPASDRPEPLQVLELQAADRVPELVPLRYGRMLVSPFTFYRGAAAIMAADLAATPSSGLWVQACGDAHLSNFGAYAAPDRDLVVDINDFDETLPGPWEWDLKRLAASFEVGARDRGFDESQRRDVVLAAARTYRQGMHVYAGLSNLDLWYHRVDVSQIRDAFAPSVSKQERKNFERNIAKTQRKNRLRAFEKLTRRVDGELRIASDPPVLVPLEEMFTGEFLKTADARLRAVLEEYRESLDAEYLHLFDGYRYVHAARKVVGVGSVGTRAWIALFVGRDDDDPLFLQVKEAQPSVLEPFTASTEFPHQGQRVVEGQRLTQSASDIMLGWLRAEGPDGEKRDFYVRQLWDQKGSAVVETMSPTTMGMYAQLCGAILARAHARSGDRIAIAGYLGNSDTFDKAIARFAVAYADQNERDYAALQAAVADGRLAIETEQA